MPVRKRVRVKGVVQGVGFRPFVYRLARARGLSGWVLNDSAGVEAEVEGEPEAVESFLRGLREECPPLAAVEEVRADEVAPEGEEGFRILPSASPGIRVAGIPPDAATCPACERELLDPSDRRYRYPFVNCTLCGPRFTIVKEVPYDRARTTMAAFVLCRECEREYRDPGDRRFHAEPTACPACGPSLSWVGPRGEKARGEEALRRAVDLLAGGGILALKGLGGFHLACDAGNDEALEKLRLRKDRPFKPFALMCRRVEDVERLARLLPHERELLAGPERPILLLEKKENDLLSPLVAPGVGEYGVMLAYTPLHILLFESGRSFPALVMTSGNRRDEPICRTCPEALERLAGTADAFLLHDRPIHNRADDSIARGLPGGRFQVLRRARGFVPREIAVDFPGRIFAAGAELKNTFCLTREGKAFLSQHIGDLDEERAFRFYEETFGKFRRLLDLEPELVCCDLHPDYLSTRFAEEFARRRGLPLVRVQHHHAHVASVLAETGWNGPVLGVAFDGTGLGLDGTVWGGEFFLFAGGRVERFAHLEPFRLPGGDVAVRKVRRIALSLLVEHGLLEEAEVFLASMGEGERRAVEGMVRKGVNSPLTSSMGRLFDAAAALAGVCGESSYEAEAAMRLEGAFRRPERPYPFAFLEGPPWRISPAPLLEEMLQDGSDPHLVSGRFHSGVARMILETARRAREVSGVETLALSGGVFQNRVLLELTRPLLEGEGFRVLCNEKVPANDGGLSLGQAWLAALGKDS